MEGSRIAGAIHLEQDGVIAIFDRRFQLRWIELTFASSSQVE